MPAQKTAVADEATGLVAFYDDSEMLLAELLPESEARVLWELKARLDAYPIAVGKEAADSLDQYPFGECVLVWDESVGSYVLPEDVGVAHPGIAEPHEGAGGEDSSFRSAGSRPLPKARRL